MRCVNHQGRYITAGPAEVFSVWVGKQSRECVSTGAAGARTRRSLGHHLLHPLILRLLVLCAPADFETQSSLL